MIPPARGESAPQFAPEDSAGVEAVEEPVVQPVADVVSIDRAEEPTEDDHPVDVDQVSAELHVAPTMADLERIWPQLVAGVRENLGARREALFREAMPGSVEGSTLVLTVPASMGFHLEQLKDDGSLGVYITERASSLLGGSVIIDFRSSDASGLGVLAAGSRSGRGRGSPDPGQGHLDGSTGRRHGSAVVARRRLRRHSGRRRVATRYRPPATGKNAASPTETHWGELMVSPRTQWSDHSTTRDLRVAGGGSLSLTPTTLIFMLSDMRKLIGLGLGGSLG